ncbi:MAG: hypothetical protein ACI3XL_01720 [Eubacteriales bacterium]
MKNAKKSVSFILSLIMVFTVFCYISVPAYALGDESAAQTYSADDITITFSEGTFTVKYTQDYDAFYRIEIEIELKKNTWLVLWETVDSVSDYSYNNAGTLKYSFSMGSSGTYRAYYTISIYYMDGSVDTVEGYKQA